MARSLFFTSAALVAFLPTVFTVTVLDRGRIDEPSSLEEHVPCSVAPDTVFPPKATTRALFWLHITKCGTSIANAILHTPSTCPGLPHDFSWQTNSRSRASDKALSLYCPDLIVSAEGHFGSHDAFGSIDRKARGSAVTLIRNPEQRILSSFHDNYHDWLLTTPPKSEVDFARVNAGCQVRMMVRTEAARGDFAKACMQNIPTKQEVTLATTVLRRDFSFVGILEEYDLSVCLFRTMFGGPCLPVMFNNVHKAATNATNKTTSATVYDTSVLHGFSDWADQSLYDEGIQIFYEMLVQYNVSEDVCQTCYDAT